MTDYKFIQKCKNCNLKNKKGMRYKNVVNRSMKEIDRINKELQDIDTYKYEGITYPINNYWSYYYKVDGRIANCDAYGYYGNHEIIHSGSKIVFYLFNRSLNIEKFKMSVHYLKMRLPDHIIYQIGQYF